MDKKVIVYITPSCPYCMRAKQLLRDNDVDFEEVDLSINPAKAEEIMLKSGQMGVPVLDIGGTIIVGFDVEKIMQALGL